MQLEILEATEPAFITVRPQLQVASQGQPGLDMRLADANFRGLGVVASADFLLTCQTGLKSAVQFHDDSWRFSIGPRHCQLVLDKPPYTLNLHTQMLQPQCLSNTYALCLSTLCARSTWTFLFDQLILSPSFNAGYRSGTAIEHFGPFAYAEMVVSLKPLGTCPLSAVIHSATGLGTPLRESAHALNLKTFYTSIYSRRLCSLERTSSRDASEAV